MSYARNNKNLPQKLQNKVDLSSPVGMNNDRLPTSNPHPDQAPGAKYVTSVDNGVIQRLGPDQPGSKISGYGGAGHSNTATYSVIVGPQSKKRNKKVINSNMYSNPDIDSDSATLYLSQKTDVDKNFGLVAGSVGSPEGLSAFAVKADSCRLISRYGIKLVTGVDDQDSIGNNIVGIKGIDLIAGNSEGTYKPSGYKGEVKYLQPIPKGDNLIKYLEELTERLDKLSSIVDNFVKFQTTLNRSFANHFHTTLPTAPFAPGVTNPDFVLQGLYPGVSSMMTTFVKLANRENRLNISSIKQNYLSEESPIFINSKYNKTT